MPDRLFLLTLLGLLTVQGGYSQSGQTVNIRLLGGRSQYGGRVEVQYNGSWWRVCSSSSYFRYQEATVVCRHLGYGTLGRLTSASGSSLASESRLQITCRGDESTLSRCSITPRQSCSSSYRQPVVECTNRNVDPYLFLIYGVPLASAIICLCAMCLPCCVACCLYAKKPGRSGRHVADHVTNNGRAERLVDQMQTQPSTPQEQLQNRSLPETPIEQITSNFNQQDSHDSQAIYEDIPETTVPLETNPSYNLANANEVGQLGHNNGDSEDYILMSTRSNNNLKATCAPTNTLLGMPPYPAYVTASTNTKEDSTSSGVEACASMQVGSKDICYVRPVDWKCASRGDTGPRNAGIQMSSNPAYGMTNTGAGERDAGIQMSSNPAYEMMNTETGERDAGIQMSSNPAYGMMNTETEGSSVNTRSEVQKGCSEMAGPLNRSCHERITISPNPAYESADSLKDDEYI